MGESLHLDGAVDTHVRCLPRCVRSFGTFRTLLSRHHWRELERWLGVRGGGGGGRGGGGLWGGGGGVGIGGMVRWRESSREGIGG